MYAHPLSANAADHAALQKSWAFAYRTGLPCLSEPQGILGKALLIGLKLLPGDVASMNTGNHKLPV